MMSRSSCEMFSYINSSLYHSQYIPWAVFSAMRAYALSSRTWPLAVGVFLLSLGPVVVNFVGTGYAVYESDGAACGLLAITWKTTFKDSRENMRVLGQRTSLSAILFRDGVIYFVTLAIMNILHLSFSLLSIVNWSFHAATSSLATFSDPLTAILVSRFLIDLQEANNALMHQGSLASMDSLAFNRFVGSLGAPLPAPLAFEPPSVSENDEQPEERSGGEAQAVATLQVA
ncbi:hypothetical protein C8Q76DRAFT_366594 [Earliella scabrosa]|nr:hypothetical protein C8Q76DRAFT_366594 [Earliella scabrosa]